MVALIDASGLKNYTSGIVTSEHCSDSPEDLNQAVLVIGYGSENKTKYWIVKNSWGTNWGEKGYVRIARDANNTCGIGNQALFAGMFNESKNYFE